LDHVIVLKGILNKDMFMRYSSVLLEVDTLSKETKTLVGVIGQYWEKYPEEKELQVDDLSVFFFSLFPKSKDREYMEKLFAQMKEIWVVNPDLLVKSLNVVVYDHMMSNVMNLANDGLSKHDPMIPQQILTEIEDFKVRTGDIEDLERKISKYKLEDILAYENSLSYKWRLKFLQETLGKPKPGRVMHLYAHTGAGKSVMMLSECTNIAVQLVKLNLDECVMYMTNEEGSKQLLTRMYAAMCGMPIKWVQENPVRAQEFWEKYGGNRIRVVEDVNHISQVQQFMHQYRPVFCFIDQGTKIQTSGSKNLKGHERLQEVYNTYRRIVVKYENNLVTCGQADDASRGRKWLWENNMDGSKVGVPGECDVLIGIGKTQEEGMQNVRYINVCKNRLTGVCDRGIVNINAEKVRYE
jgi:hypothetical protein